jgi:hypothetical protein
MASRLLKERWVGQRNFFDCDGISDLCQAAVQRLKAVPLRVGQRQELWCSAHEESQQ